MNGTRYLVFLLFPVCLSGCGGAYQREIREHRSLYRESLLRSMKGVAGEEGPMAEPVYYRPSPRYRVTARVRLTPGQEPFDMATFDGEAAPYVRYAVASFTLRGRPVELCLYRSLRQMRMPQFRDLLFAPFKDLTNGAATYGGGRYLDFRLGDIREGRLVIDFNKSYNPLCAYREGAQCPVPPAENHLGQAIKAGEKDLRPKPAKL